MSSHGVCRSFLGSSTWTTCPRWLCPCWTLTSICWPKTNVEEFEGGFRWYHYIYCITVYIIYIYIIFIIFFYIISHYIYIYYTILCTHYIYIIQLCTHTKCNWTFIWYKMYKHHQWEHHSDGVGSRLPWSICVHSLRKPAAMSADVAEPPFLLVNWTWISTSTACESGGLVFLFHFDQCHPLWSLCTKCTSLSLLSCSYIHVTCAYSATNTDNGAVFMKHGHHIEASWEE